MHELIVNLHMHTRYSDGTGSHGDIGQAALRAGVDVIIVTDHNVLVEEAQGYFRNGKQRCLLLVDEEIHDQARQPQKNHLLVFNAQRELATYANDPQVLIDNARRAGGLSFLAHPTDAACPVIGETSIDWVDWQVQGYNGIELWNGLSELKTHSPTIFHAIFHLFFPQFIGHGPDPSLLARWDSLLNQGRRLVAIGGSDAHALHISKGPFKRTVFPYEWHFKTINTHIFTPTPLTGQLEEDARMIYEALAAGHCFVANDLPASARGFRFSAQGREKTALMGDEISAEGSLTLQVRLPQNAEGRLLKDGQVIRQWNSQEALSHITTQPGIYRVEAYLKFLGKQRGWIFSNPIYVRE
ncbi:MAG: hypothetical protein CVU44_09045 [Chloroflexi bacterium HGW-Chloroflexi-6]|nr:MAG: hypothetical protein CVU44_09045 [Chloroflexi bacterium HGW-Chloroflexi-6]